MRILAITFLWLKYKKILAYNIYTRKHATSVNFDTNYVFVSCVVFELCQFLILGARKPSKVQERVE